MEKVEEVEKVEKQKDFFKLNLLEIKKVLFDLNMELKDIPSGNESYCSQLIYLIISKCWNDYDKRYSEFDLDHGQKHIHDMMIRNFNILSWYIKINGFEEFQKIGIKNINVLFYVVGVAAIFHDLFQEENRLHHHELAALYAEKIQTFIRKQYDIVDGKLVGEYRVMDWEYKFRSLGKSKLVALLCKEHRASFNGEFSNILCEIFSAADRDTLDLKTVIQRSYSYTKKRREVNPRRNIIIEIGGTQYYVDKLMRDLITNDWEFEKVEVFYHIIDKFSKVGYMFTNIKPNGIFMEYYKNDIQKFWDEIDHLITHPLSFEDYLK